MRLNKGDMVMMPEPRMMNAVFIVCVCLCLWVVLVIEKVWVCLIESGDEVLRVTRILRHLFGGCQAHFVERVVAADLLLIESDKHLAFDRPCACAATLGFEDSVCLAAKPLFKAVEDAAIGKRAKGNASGERFDCWGGHGGGGCVGHERKLADESRNARKIFHFSIFISRSSLMNA